MCYDPIQAHGDRADIPPNRNHSEQGAHHVPGRTRAVPPEAGKGGGGTSPSAAPRHSQHTIADAECIGRDCGCTFTHDRGNAKLAADLNAPVVSLGQCVTRELGADGKWRDKGVEPDHATTIADALEEWRATGKAIERLADLLNGEDFRQKPDGGLLLLPVSAQVRNMLSIATAKLAPALAKGALNTRIACKELESYARAAASADAVG